MEATGTMKRKVLLFLIPFVFLFFTCSCKVSRSIDTQEQKISIPRTLTGFIDIEKLHHLCDDKVYFYYPNAFLVGLYVRTTNSKNIQLSEGQLTFEYFDEYPLFLGLFKQNIQVFCSVDIQAESVQLKQYIGNQYFIATKQELSSNEEFERVLKLGFSNNNGLVSYDNYFELEFWLAGKSWEFRVFSGASKESSTYKCFRINESSFVIEPVPECDFND